MTTPKDLMQIGTKSNLALLLAQDWTSWTPTYTGSGSLTYTSVTTNHAKYVRIGDMVVIMVKATGTVGGAAAKQIQFTLPIEAASQTGAGAGSANDDGGTAAGAFVEITGGSPPEGAVSLSSGSNWTEPGTNTAFNVMAVYEAA